MSRILIRLRIVIYQMFVWGNIAVIVLLARAGKLVFRLQHRKKNEPREKKFALISHILPPTASGQSIMLERILRGIDPEKYILIATEQTLHNQKNQIPELPAQRITVVENVPAEHFYSKTFIYFGAAILKAFKRGWLLAQNTARENCTTLIGCSGDPYDLPATYFASVFSDTELIPYYFDDYFYQWGDRQHRRLAGIFEKVMVRKARGIIVPNEFLQKEAIARGYVKAQLVRNPTHENRTPAVEAQAETTRAFDFSVLFAGSVYHVNAGAISLLQQATKLLAPYGVSCSIDIYSNQSAEQIFSYGIRPENIRIHNHVPSDEISEKMRAADFLLIPFAAESTIPEVVTTSAPGKMGDYLSSGRPILALVPENSFVAWYLSENQSGVVIESETPLVIAKELKRLAKNKKRRARLAANGIRKAQEDFGRELAAEKFANFVFDQPTAKTRIVYISASDQGGQQFNGNLLGQHLDPGEFQSYMSVAKATSNLGNVYEYGNGAYTSLRSRILQKKNERQSRQALYSNYQISSILPEALLSEMDIIHLQMIHGAPFFNLKILPELSRRYKLVMTIHDQWIMSGHCTYALACDRWLHGCGNCPDLKRDIPMRSDKTAEMYQVKKRILAQTELQLVVASQWMYDKVKESPLLQKFPIEKIPFGIDTAHYYQDDDHDLKKRWNIPKKHKVMSVRTNLTNMYKGTKYLVEALQNVDYKDLTIITFDHGGCLNSVRGKFNVIDLGWVQDVSLMRKIFSISDLFLSPSVAESFGIMPLEAMACGAVPVVFQDTVLAETIGWPDYGVVVPYLDSMAYAAELTALLRDPARIKALSEKGKSMPASRYPLSGYVEGHENLYRRMMAE